MVRSYLFFRDRRQQHGIEWNTLERGRSCQIFLEIREYLLTSRKGKDAEMSVRKSDMLIVAMKQGNSCGAKGHALLCRGLMRH